MPFRVQFADYEQEKVWAWAEKDAANQIDWGEENPEKPRTPEKIEMDLFQGKLGEWAWDKYCVKEHGMTPRISWTHRPKGADDHADFIYPNKVRLEVKTNKNVREDYYILVPTQRIWKADYFLMASVGWKGDFNAREDTGGPIGWVDLLGHIDRDRLKCGKVLKRGDLLPPRNTVPMRVNNFALKIVDLDHNLLHLAEKIGGRGSRRPPTPEEDFDKWIEEVKNHTRGKDA